jgi:hypothetical protein
VVLLVYALGKPIYGFLRDTRQVVTIPEGAKIRLGRDWPAMSLCQVSWDGRNLMVFGCDLQENGLSVEDMPQDG